MRKETPAEHSGVITAEGAEGTPKKSPPEIGGYYFAQRKLEGRMPRPKIEHVDRALRAIQARSAS